MKKFTNIPAFTLPVLSLVVIGSLLLIFESDFLWRLQENNLFLNSKIFFKEQMLEPGGFLSWVGTWFTQFFFHPWLGVLILCAWWLLLMWLVQRTFRISLWWMPITIIPVLFLLVTIVDMGYWVYILKLRGHVFVGTVGTTAVVAFLWAFRLVVAKVQVKQTLVRSAFVVMTCALGYPLLGIYGIGATALMAVWIWRVEPRRLSALIVSLTGFLSAWLLPLFFYRFVYYQTNLANIYVAKLPLYYVTQEYSSYYLPFVLLLLFFLVMSLLPNSLISIPFTEGGEVLRLDRKEQGKRGSSPRRGAGKGSSPFLHGRLVGQLVSLLLLLATAVYTYTQWYKDENFHHELAMQRHIDRLDWAGVLKEAAEQEGEPTRAIVMMRNLALAQLGRQGNEMYHYKNGCKRCDAPFDIRAINSAGDLIYYYYGMPNYSYRLCMERGVEFGWRIEQLKFMTRCSMVNGELQLARKYLGLLKQTMFYDSWADDMYEYTEHPENIAQMPEMEFITHMMHYKNSLTSDHNLVEDFLMKRLIHSNYTADPVFLEQKVLASMQAKNASLFWAHLQNYMYLYPDRTLPIHVQEAAYLLADLEERPDKDKMPVSPAVKENYKRFDQTASRLEGADWAAAQAALYPLFGNTYFYDYYMVNFPAQN